MPPTLLMDQRTGAVCIPDVIYPEQINITTTHKGPIQVTLTFYATPQYSNFPPAMTRSVPPTGNRNIVQTTAAEDPTEAEFDRMMAEGTPVEIVTDRDISTLR